MASTGKKAFLLFERNRAQSEVFFPEKGEFMNQMAEAMKSAKTIQAEITQWENRLEEARNEHGNLKRQSEVLQGEIDQKRNEYANYISTTQKQLRDGLDQLNADQGVLKNQRDVFKSELDKHLTDKAAFAHEKSEFEKEKSRVAGSRQLVNDFIQAVRRAYNVLPE
jgi:chromosome segregation ATPase